MRLATLALAVLLATAADSYAQLLEEAPNHETVALQHLTVLTEREAVFTQEWTLPLGAHQFSATIPVTADSHGSRLNDVSLNYRYQFGTADRTRRWALATRVSFIVPAGEGPAAIQINVPLSASITPRITANTNGGATCRADACDVILGQNMIVALPRSLEAIAEATWTREEGLAVAPGLQWRVEVGGAELIPGIAFRLNRDGTRSLSIYLSLEHALAPGT